MKINHVIIISPGGDYEANETIKGGGRDDESRLCSPSAAIGGVMSIVLDEQ